MKRIVNVLMAVGATAVASVGTAAAPAVAVTHHAAGCSSNWGTNAKHRGDQAITVATRVRGVRAGKHGCFDRLVIDMSGGKQPPFTARYVKPIVADPSGKILKVRGKAKILIVVRGPAGRPQHATTGQPVNVSRLQTFPPGRSWGAF